jgi:hypothetical protein
MWRARNRYFELELTDARIAEAIGRSRRYVQLALAELQAKGWIVRDFIFKVSRWGNTVYRRVIKLIFRPAGSEPKSKSTIDLDPKKLDPHRANPCDMISHAVALSSSDDEVKTMEQQRAVVGESDGTDPPTAQGNAEPAALAPVPETAEEIRALFDRIAAQVQETAAPEPASKPQDDARAARGALDPAQAASVRQSRYEAACARGDDVAMREFAPLPDPTRPAPNESPPDPASGVPPASNEADPPAWPE